LLPCLEVESDVAVQFFAARFLVGDEDEILLAEAFAPIQAHQVADLVIDVSVAECQISDQQAGAFDDLQNLVVDGVAVAGAEMVNSDFPQFDGELPC
jgi:hypothetical protein